MQGLLAASPTVLAWMAQPARVSRFTTHYNESPFGSERGDLVGQPMDALAPGHLCRLYPEHADVSVAEAEVRPAGLDPGPNHYQGCAELPLTVSRAHRSTEDVSS